MSAHKPRRRKENGVSLANYAGSPSAGISSQVDIAPFTLAELLVPGRRASQWILLPVLLAVAYLFRWSVGLWGFSGEGITPMHGDFEAQRHWMEITSHLPPAKWYFYDLEYWGLDYPPLTAYHSFLLGKLGSVLNKSWFALDASRGYESESLKLFMRASVAASELLLYVPSIIAACKRLAGLHGSSRWDAMIAMSALLMQPGTVLIDHGHFQYNTVMLGLVVAALNSWLNDRYALGCAYFVASLAFKQMALYYAPAVFAYLLGVCVFPRINIARFMIIALSTALAFAVMWTPLLLGAWCNHVQDPKIIKSLEPPYLFTTLTEALPFPVPNSSHLYVILLQLTQSVHRIFPLARGLFEDKVANLWLAVHSVYKLNNFPVELLSRVSLLATLAAISPSCLIIFLRPRKSLLPLALASSAWSFFLLSFQVHEKSVLLPLLPMTLLLASEPAELGPETRAWVGWANTLGAWTLYPLLKRDGQAVPYVSMTLLWTILLDLPPLRWTLYRLDIATPQQASAHALALHVASYVIMAVWHGCELFIEPPDRKPDLWIVINCLVGAVGFSVCWLWCNGMLLYRSGLLDPWFKAPMGSSGSEKEVVGGSVATPAKSAISGGKRSATSSSSSAAGAPKKKA